MRSTAIRLTFAAVAVAALGFAADPALARPGGGMGIGMGGGMGAGLGAGGHMGGFGGMSGSHINGQGSLNTNGPNATDRDFGRDRAIDRANANANLSNDTDVRAGRTNVSVSSNAGGSANAIAHRWRHGRHHHYGWRAH